MADTNKNLGVSRKIKVFVEDKKLGRDFTQVKNFSWDPAYYEGEDEYLGDGDVVPWQYPKGASGSFDIEESNASYIHAIEQAKNDALRTGSRPKIVIVEQIQNFDGTSSKTTFNNCALVPKWGVNGKGEKVIVGYSFRSTVPKME